MVVDDHPLWRQGVRADLERHGVAIVVAEASDGLEAVQNARTAGPEVVVMDLQLPTMNGVEATRRLVEEEPEVRVLVLSASGEEADVLEAVKAGASGYLLKSATGGEVADAVLRVHAGEPVFSPSLAARVLDEFRRRGRKEPARLDLAQQAREVLGLVARGYTYREIARKLSISAATVRHHMQDILTRLQLGHAGSTLDEGAASAPQGPDARRILATVLFTDIVGSTELAARIGDHRWKDVLESHHALVRRQLALFGGREVDTIGDGFLATFDSPAQAIRCACAIRDVVVGLGLSIRAGLHTGEFEVVDDRVGGIAVHIGARVAALAEGGEVLASSTVKDLVAGSGIEFLDRGTHTLKGVPGEWHLYAVAG
jgi:DNA-binding NarL/FixJ family response regulator